MEGAIVSALLIGDSSLVPEHINDALRKAGTAHLVAISGMHMALISGMLFYIIRLLILPLCYKFQWINSKKWAAFFAIITSFVYLLIAGSPISAQRAFFMSLIFFFAIILDLRSSPIHSLCAAVTILLIIMPESLFSPSFQMSISACLGLICSAPLFINHKVKVFSYIANLTIASTVAWLSSSMFAAYHFHQISSYSLFANLILVPITEIIGMPSGMLGIIAIPFGLEKIPLQITGYTTQALAVISMYFAQLKWSSIFIAPFDGYLLAIYSIGVFVFCIIGGVIRYVSIIVIITSTIIILCAKVPDLIVSENIFAVRCKENALCYSSRIKSRYMRKVWNAHVGSLQSETLPKYGMCNRFHCTYGDKLNSIVTRTALKLLI